ncbi:MAG TPA: hypothetical protein VGW32_11020, partial [Pyrinomonadaceae bacterium]|nr:hypothetical protein [Pyrinomonadaceae bacterium]
RMSNATAEADNAKCAIDAQEKQDLSGQMFRYERVSPTSAQVLLTAPNGDPLVTSNKIGRGRVVFVAVPDLLGEDERMTPFAAHLLAHLFSEATPVRVEGDIEYLVNRNANGWVGTIFNDNGVFKPLQGLAQVDRSAVANVTVGLRNQKVTTATEWLTDSKLLLKDGANVQLSIPPGGIAIVELK